MISRSRHIDGTSYYTVTNDFDDVLIITENLSIATFYDTHYPRNNRTYHINCLSGEQYEELLRKERARKKLKKADSS
ncbi:MAG: hypothetical protein EB168_06400 [Euryarchaeota archaeon]|jgi:hypothetical protein|nr:hypothetical protein [Euryarchaeota archaeon]